jgi:hypothetical protein
VLWTEKVVVAGPCPCTAAPIRVVAESVSIAGLAATNWYKAESGENGPKTLLES